MVLTDAERQKRRREKLKNKGQYADYLKKHAEYSRKCHLRQQCALRQLTLSEQKVIKTNKRERTRERVRKCRALKAARQETAKENGVQPVVFNSAEALAKAMARAKKALQSALPRSPRRNEIVRQKLFPATVVSVKQTRRTSAVSENTVSLVKKFYERDDVRRIAPGRKDFMTIRKEDGEKVQCQKRHLTSSIKEVHAQYCEEFPQQKIGKSKFAELRPQHVLLSNKLPHNVCLCKYHSNFKLAMDALHGLAPEKLAAYSHDTLDELTCLSAKEECYVNDCDLCKDGMGFSSRYPLDTFSEESCSWYVWKVAEDGVMTKCVEEGTTEDLYMYLKSLIPQFVEHCHVKQVQAAAYQEERAAMDQVSSKALLQVDFAENYTCVAQDEIQSAHWHQRQVSLFTAALWHSGELHPIVLVSDNLVHAKETVVAYMSQVLEQVPESVTEVSIWSDGPASQFKNRFIAESLKVLQHKCGKKLTWNYFATSHGKGPVDGIGGSLKRQVWNAVKCRKVMVNDATTFAAAASTNSNVVVKVISEEETKNINALLKVNEVFERAQVIKGISKVHCMQVGLESGRLMTYPVTNNLGTVLEDIAEHTTEPEHAIEAVKVGDWYCVSYDGVLFPGEVLELCAENNEYKISVMHPAGGYWKWPKVVDCIYITNKVISLKC